MCQAQRWRADSKKQQAINKVCQCHICIRLVSLCKTRNLQVFFQQKKSSLWCTLINGNASIFAGRTRSSGRGGSRRALMQHVSWTGHDGTLCGSICVSLNSCLFFTWRGSSHQERRGWEEGQRRDVSVHASSTCTWYAAWNSFTCLFWTVVFAQCRFSGQVQALLADAVGETFKKSEREETRENQAGPQVFSRSQIVSELVSHTCRS